MTPVSRHMTAFLMLGAMLSSLHSRHSSGALLSDYNFRPLLVGMHAALRSVMGRSAVCELIIL